MIFLNVNMDLYIYVLGIVGNQKNVTNMAMYTPNRLPTIYEGTLCDLMNKTLNLEDDYHPLDNLMDYGTENQRVQEDIIAEVPVKYRTIAPNQLHIKKLTGIQESKTVVVFDTAIISVRLDRRPSVWCPMLGYAPTHPVHALVITMDAQNAGQYLLNVYDVTNEYPVVMHHPIGTLNDSGPIDLYYVTNTMIEINTPDVVKCVCLPLF